MWLPEPMLQPADFPQQCATLFRQLLPGSAFPTAVIAGLDLSDPSSEEHFLRSYGYTGRAQSTRL
jgi:hypothetical protein